MPVTWKELPPDHPLFDGSFIVSPASAQKGTDDDDETFDRVDEVAESSAED